MAVRIEKQAEPIPGYRLLDRLGGGGFGEVWRAEAPGGLHKAIKFVYGDLQDAGDDAIRAEQELKALRRVQTVRHPYILSLERYDIIDGQLLIVMELADKNLWDRYKECRAEGHAGIPREEMLGYMEETAEALDLMNLQYGLQHLDIKPQNLFLVHNHVKVADFGLVKDLEGMRASVTGGVTPVYAAPETFDGWVSRFSDQYSLGIVYQELLTGHRPFTGNNVRQLVLQHLQGTPDLSSLVAADQPVVARALAKDPEDRFPTCKEMVQALRRKGEPRTASTHSAGVPEGAGPEAQPAFARTPEVEDSGEELDTPRPSNGVFDSSDKPTFCIRQRDEKPTDTPVETAAEARPPVEVRGDGCLFPAVVIGLGGVGQAVLRKLRATLRHRLGNGEALPSLRLLLLDTDPDAGRDAGRDPPDEALLPQEVFLTPLNRPAHYLKSREGRVAIDSWLDTKMLYRIPRGRVTLGVRALGRLAFCDNYRTLVRRLHAELAACLDPAALQDADRRTGLGVRSTRPRVYIVTGLAGGTGSGMFIDLAYAIRAQLRQLGYAPDVVGLLAAPSVPPADPDAPPVTPGPRQAARRLALSNAYAALSELRYFARPGKTFQARYYDREPALQDAEPPFNRCLVIPLDAEGGDEAARQLAGVASEFLARDLCSPLEPAAERARAEVQEPPGAERGLFCQTFGLYRWSAPYHQLVQHAARTLAVRLLQHWMSKDAIPLRQRVEAWGTEQWSCEGWNAEAVAGRLEDAGRQILGKPAEEAFTEILQPLIQLVGEGNGKGGAQVPDAGLVVGVAERLEAVVGWPPSEEVVGKTAQLPEALREVAQDAVAQWGQRVAELVVGFIELPDFRLAGAEEAVRQVIGRIEKVLAEHEPRSRELGAQAAEVYSRLGTAVLNLRRLAIGKGRQVVTAGEVLGLLRQYARSRYQSLLEQQLIAAYVSLRGQLSDQLREVNFCRVRLTELLNALGGAEKDEQAAADRKPASPARLHQASGSLLQRTSGSMAASAAPTTPEVQEKQRTRMEHCLFPNGCRSLDQAVASYLEGVTPEVLRALDEKVQALLQRQFTSLVNVCLSSANLVQDLELALRREVEAFVTEDAGKGLAAANVTELFLDLFADPESARAELLAGYEAAAPELGGIREFGIEPAQIAVLLAPAHPASEELREVVREALPGIDLAAASGGDDLVLYREVPYLPLGGLAQLGPNAEEAYRHMLTAECFTPHTRIDIPFKSP
jgi:serine/threonine protein kinase